MTATIPDELKLLHIPRGMRPRCGAITRSGKPCCGQALIGGRCYVHSGLASGAMSAEGKERQRANGRAVMRRLWAERWANGKPLSEGGRARIIAGQKRRSAESRYPSEETRRKISQGRRRP